MCAILAVQIFQLKTAVDFAQNGMPAAHLTIVDQDVTAGIAANNGLRLGKYPALAGSWSRLADKDGYVALARHECGYNTCPTGGQGMRGVARGSDGDWPHAGADHAPDPWPAYLLVYARRTTWFGLPAAAGPGGAPSHRQPGAL